MSKFVPDQILDRIRQATDIVQLVQESLPLRKSGSAFKALCPFHREKTPSFHVNPERQIFKCFGCGAGGDIFTYLMKTEGVSFGEAVRMLAERAHIDLPADSARGPGRQEKEQLYDVNAWAADTFHRWLTEHQTGKDALAYIQQRGVTLDTVKRFKLGYSPKGWDSLLKAAQRKKHPTALLAKAGLLAQSDHSEGMYDRFRNRLMFPIRDTLNRVIGFGARALDNTEPKYLNTPETPLFSKGRVVYGIDLARDALREKRQAIVVEGYMDVIIAHQSEIPWTVAVLGTALTRDHVHLLRRYVDEAVLVFDADAAGQNSASRSVDAFAAEELSVRVMSLPKDSDPDDFLRKEGMEAFLDIARQATDGVTFKLDRALASLPQGVDAPALPAARALDDVLATVALMPNSIARSIEVKKISERARLPEHSLLSRLRQLKLRRRPLDNDAPSAQPASVGREVERELLVAMLTYPATLPLVRDEVNLEHLQSSHIRAIVQRLLERDDVGDDGPEYLLARTQDESQRAIVEGIIGGNPVQAEDPQRWCRELVNEIEARSHVKRGQQLHRKVVDATGKEDLRHALMERLHAAREAQRRRGKLDLKKA